MADLPINSVSVDMSSINNVSINPSKGLQQAMPSSTSKMLDHNVIASQVLSKTPNELVLSLPNQPALRIDMSNNAALIQQLNIGDKVTLTIAHDKKTAVITISQQAPRPTVELTLPLSQSLSSALNRDTSLPAKESLIQSHIEKNGALLLGQARRLPQEQITIKVSESITIKATLPGVNTLPLNTTMQASLILSNEKQLIVQFTKRPTSLPSIQLILPLNQLTTNKQATLLQNIPMTSVASINEVLDPATLLTHQTKKPDTVDMSKPLNQLWLRHQPVAKALGILTSTLQEASTLNRDQIKSELALQQIALSSTVTSKQLIDIATVPSSTNPIKHELISEELKALVKSDIDNTTKQLKSNMPLATPLTLKELGQSISKELPKEQSKELFIESAKEVKDPLIKGLKSAANNILSTTPTINYKKLDEAIPEQNSKNSIKSDLPPLTSNITAAIKESITLNSSNEALLKQTEKKSLNLDGLKTPFNHDATKQLSKVNDLLAASTSAPERVNISQQTMTPQTKTLQTIAAQALTTHLSTQASETHTVKVNKGDITSSLDKNPLNKAPIEKMPIDNASFNKASLAQAPLTQTMMEKSPSLSLQKLNALISALHSSTNATKETNQFDKAPLTNNSTSETSDDELVAIDQLKNLSQRLNKQLPAMSQLTNPAQLSQLVEQFTRFEPLSSASINLSSLGPLASALQLMLGGRQAAQNQPLSPQLLKHLGQLLKNTRGGSASNLTSALQMLGNLQSFKPLEEALTNVSSNIQFYQYQNVDQQQNNQSLFYFNLPTKEPQVPQVEGEVEQQESNDPNGEKSWRLTLLLPCGDSDKIKVNALLTGNNVELDLTCNNQSLVERANFYKNFLASRLETLGFGKTTVNCQQGEIPATLLKRPNQLVELMI